MPSNEVFEVSKKKGEDADIKLNANIFAVEGEAGESVEEKVKEINKLLKTIKKDAESDLSSDETSAAMLIIERSLEDAMPDNFSKLYKEATEEGGWKRAAEMIQTHILDDLNDFVNKKVGDNLTDLDHYIKTVDDKDFVYLSSEQAAEILKDLEPNTDADELNVFRSRYSNPTLKYVPDLFADATKGINDSREGNRGIN